MRHQARVAAVVAVTVVPASNDVVVDSHINRVVAIYCKTESAGDRDDQLTLDEGEIVVLGAVIGAGNKWIVVRPAGVD